MSDLADRLLAARDVYTEQGGGSGPGSYRYAPLCVLGACREALGIHGDMGSWDEDIPRDQIDALYSGLTDDQKALAGFDRYAAVYRTNDSTDGDLRREVVLDLFDRAIRNVKDGEL